MHARIALSWVAVALLGCGKPPASSTVETPLASASAAASIAPPPSASVVIAVASADPVAAGGAGGAGGATDAVQGPCPPEMALLKTVCIDRWEDHLAERQADGTLVPHPHNERPKDHVTYVAVSEPDVFPQGYMSRVDSAAACRAAGKRLCSRGEWRRGCEGKTHRHYSYGYNHRANVCNSGKDHLLSKLYGTNGHNWKYDENFNNPELLALEGYLAKTGAYDGCVSDEGVHDMVGNLQEWVSDTMDEDSIDRFKDEEVERRHQPMKPGNGVFLGGFFSTTSELGSGCDYATVAHEPSYHDYSIGFRCCQAADLPGAKKTTRAPAPAASPR